MSKNKKKSKQPGVPAKTVSLRAKSDSLRALRLAQEAARKEAGTWGETTVGEILHEASRSVFVQVWKGQRRPDPFPENGMRRPSPAGDEWPALIAWIDAQKSIGFIRRIVAWDLSAGEARKIAQTRIAEHRAAGYTVINPAEARP